MERNGLDCGLCRITSQRVVWKLSCSTLFLNPPRDYGTLQNPAVLKVENLARHIENHTYTRRLCIPFWRSKTPLDGLREMLFAEAFLIRVLQVGKHSVNPSGM